MQPAQQRRGIATRKLEWLIESADVAGCSIEVSALRDSLKLCNLDWRPLIPEWDHISQQILGEALPAVITGDKPAKKAMDAVVKDVEDVARKGGWLKT